MPERLGTRVNSPTGRHAPLFARDFGEDWVVPRSGIRYLVLARLGTAALLSAYDQDGRLVGERFEAEAAVLLETLRGLAAAGHCDPIVTIPEGTESALAFLARGT